MEISGWIAHWAAWSPDKPAVRFEGRTLSYEALEARVSALAAYLRGSAVEAGDRVAYLGPSTPELLEALFACARIGAIFVPLNARMPPAELRTFFAQTTPRLLLAERGFVAVAEAAVPAATGVTVFSAGQDVVATSGDRIPANAEADAGAPALILFTSGTTGAPKGAVLTNDSVFANAGDITTALGMTAADEVLTYTPLFHVAGLNLLTIPALSVGATVTIHRDFRPGAILADIAALGITMLISPPHMTAPLAADPTWRTTNLSRVRCVITGGTVVTERAIEPWRARGVPVVQSYGMTEAGPNVTLVPPDVAGSKALTAGKPTLRQRLRIVDPSGADVDPGTPGEIVVRGPAVMAGYWNNATATDEVLRDGWLRTGDVGFVDTDGYLHVVDRIKETIVVGVSNVFPADLEAVLDASPALAASAVVGRKDEQLGEVPVAFVVPAPGTNITRDDVMALFDGRLAAYKRPHDVVFLETMPTTSVGKPEKQVLRRLVNEREGVTHVARQH